MTRAPGFLRSAVTIAGKDLRIEFRTKSAILASALFAVLALATFYFGWNTAVYPAAAVAPGVLWIVLIFAALLGVQRSFGAEQYDRAIDGLLLAPVPREAIFLGKALANLGVVWIILAILVPALCLFYNLTFSAAPTLYGVGLVMTIGLVAITTLFSAMASNTRLAELLVPMLSLPFFMPPVVAAAQLTTRLLEGRPLAEVSGWLRLLVAYDLVFVFACIFLYPRTLEE